MTPFNTFQKGWDRKTKGCEIDAKKNSWTNGLQLRRFTGNRSVTRSGMSRAPWRGRVSAIQLQIFATISE